VILFGLPVFDPKLVLRAQVMNDEEKLRKELVGQAEATLHRLARDMKLPGDVVDEAIDLLRGQVLHRFRSCKDWDQVKFPDAYLQTAARRAILRALHRAKRRGRLKPPGSLPADPKVLDALRKPNVTYGEIMAKVAKGMKMLTPTEFEVMNLVLRNYTLTQIALTLDLSAGAVYVHVCNARKKMRQIWNDSA
jgi:DNA-directed RNA polymerase specialized sigma24 family protein